MANDKARTRILEAAALVFAERGYEEATVREICERADVNLAAVNYYFGGKERLYIEILERVHSRQGQQPTMPEWPPGTPAPAKLRHFIGSFLTHLLRQKEEPWEMRLMMREILGPTPAGKKFLTAQFRKGFDQLQGILDEMLAAEVPAYKRHQIAFSIFGQCIYYHAAGRIIPLVIEESEWQAHYSVEQLAEHITQMCLAALGLGPPVACPAAKHGAKAKRRKTVAAGVS
jgi:AcrR family transcriptional regulator